jgi:hypothetical protein
MLYQTVNIGVSGKTENFYSLSRRHLKGKSPVHRAQDYHLFAMALLYPDPPLPNTRTCIMAHYLLLFLISGFTFTKIKSGYWMEAQGISNTGYLNSRTFPAQEVPQGSSNSFRSALDTSMSLDRLNSAGVLATPIPAGQKENNIFPTSCLLSTPPPPKLRTEAAAAYAKQASLANTPTQMSSWAKYKDDQLLRNPGGDNYYLDENMVVDDPKERESFFGRVGKDLADVAGNIKNFFGNLFMGSKVHYREEDNQIKEGTQRGLIGTCVDFVKDLGSALTFGLWHPDDEKGPHGFMERISYVGSKLKQAVLGDLVEGIPQSVNHMGKNIVLAGLNLVQVLPDSTIGNLEGGRKLTTSIFDNGQVMVEYLIDIIPTGDAWFRVHASNLTELEAPLLYNLKMPEYVKGDSRWQYVRNTPFRKTIETVGTLLTDIASIGIGLQTGISTNREAN